MSLTVNAKLIHFQANKKDIYECNSIRKMSPGFFSSLPAYLLLLSTRLRVVRCKQFTTNEGMLARRWGGETKKNHWYPTMSGYSSKGDLLQPIYRWFDDWQSPSEQLNSTHTHTVDKFLGACSFLPSMATQQQQEHDVVVP